MRRSKAELDAEREARAAEGLARLRGRPVPKTKSRPTKRGSAFEEGRFCLLGFDGLEKFAVNPGVGGFAWRVLMLLIAGGSLTYGNTVRVNQTAFAVRYGMQRSHVSNAIKELVKAGALLPRPSEGGHRVYQLNPLLAWMGKGLEHGKAIADLVASRSTT